MEHRPVKGAATNELLLIVQERHLGAEHPHIAGTLHNLATSYRLQGRSAEAEPLLKRALEINETAYGAEHRTVATSFADLGGFYLDSKRYDEALTFYERSLEVEKALGAENLRVAKTLELYAAALRKKGRFGEASQAEARANAIRAKH